MSITKVVLPEKVDRALGEYGEARHAWALRSQYPEVGERLDRALAGVRRAVAAAILRAEAGAYETMSDDARVPMTVRADMDQQSNALRVEADVLEREVFGDQTNISLDKPGSTR